jgi:Na+/H+ antiporter NhaA
VALKLPQAELNHLESILGQFINQIVAHVIYPLFHSCNAGLPRAVNAAPRAAAGLGLGSITLRVLKSFTAPAWYASQAGAAALVAAIAPQHHPSHSGKCV